MRPCFGFILALLSPALALAADEARIVEANITLDGEAALPDGSVLVLKTGGEEGEIFTEWRRVIDGTVTGFSVPAPATGEATIRAAIETGGRLSWLSKPVSLASGEEDVDLTLVRADAPPAPVVFHCGEKQVSVIFDGEMAELLLDEEHINLHQARSGSGARYVATDDPETEVWVKGESAQITIKGEPLPECGPPPGFRASGNEPFWRLVISDGRVILETGAGGESREAALPEPLPENGEWTRTIPAIGAVISSSDEMCRDDMSGMPYPKTVSVERDGEMLKGCGGTPIDLLTGGEWRVEDIGGGGVIDHSRASIAFSTDGTASGLAGCNHFRAGFFLTGERLSFGPAAMTRKRCIPALMNEEKRFGEALSMVTGFDIDETGALILKSVTGETVMSARKI